MNVKSAIDPRYYDSLKNAKIPDCMPAMEAKLTRRYFPDPGWAKNGKLRHPWFVGLQRDKKPKQVVREDS